MNETEFRDLYNRYVRNQCTPDEILLFMQEAAVREIEVRQLFDVSWKELDTYPGQYNIPSVILPQQQTAGKIRRFYYVAAAVMAGCIALGVWLLLQNRPTADKAGVVAKTADRPAGRQGGILTLSNGKTILLDEAANGALATESGTIVFKQDGVIAYDVAEASGNTPVYNSISTPRGRQYSLVLADGSKVWLNAGSSVRYPAAFTGKSREVEVTGEVYFEVAKKDAVPFSVTVKDIKIQVLGTSFNINANDEDGRIRTTLLQGAVKVVNPVKTVKLLPGQQAVAGTGEPLRVQDGVNVEEATAWRNGYFHFESADLKTILRQFSLWYDIDVVYEGQVKERKFFAIVKRSSSLNSVLQLLKDQNIQFRLEGRTLIVKQE